MQVGIGAEDHHKAHVRDSVRALDANLDLVEIHKPTVFKKARERERARQIKEVGKHRLKMHTGWGRMEWHHCHHLLCLRRPALVELHGHSWLHLFLWPLHLVRSPLHRQRRRSSSGRFLGVLKKHETEIPPEVSEVVKDTKLTEGISKIKNMHDAVENLGEAQQTFEKACFARAQNLASWRQFLHLSVQRWQEYTQHFLTQEKYNLEQIATARDAVKNAQAIFKNLQEQGVITIDAEEDPAMVDEEPTKTESSRRIQEGLEHMTSSLEHLANQADKEHAEEQQLKKRARKEPPDDTGTLPPPAVPPSASGALGSTAMEPFGTAHSG